MSQRREVLHPDFPEYSWTKWIALNEWKDSDVIPKQSGLYRIRRKDKQHLDYLGQTGMTLRERLSMLNGVYKAEMPYRDPHTAGPALWAIKDLYARQGQRCEFEVSVCVIEMDAPGRKGFECLALALHREQFNASPTFNFGAMPPGYRMSSANNAKLVKAGKRFRGGHEGEQAPTREASLPFFGGFKIPFLEQNWCGLLWNEWCTEEKALACLKSKDVGLYRIRFQDQLLYIGEGKIKGRFKAHLAKANKAGHAQAEFFGLDKLQFSWAIVDRPKHQLLEFENDLIASYLLQTQQLPWAQFKG